MFQWPTMDKLLHPTAVHAAFLLSILFYSFFLDITSYILLIIQEWIKRFVSGALVLYNNRAQH